MWTTYVTKEVDGNVSNFQFQTVPDLSYSLLWQLKLPRNQFVCTSKSLYCHLTCFTVMFDTFRLQGHFNHIRSLLKQKYSVVKSIILAIPQ